VLQSSSGDHAGLIPSRFLSGRLGQFWYFHLQPLADGFKAWGYAPGWTRGDKTGEHRDLLPGAVGPEIDKSYV
jgi:hypothetical protein